jgi:hypothetical protein
MTFEELVEIARDDDVIVGLVLTGSRGRDYVVHEKSDWDVRLVVADDVVDEYRRRYATPHGSPVEIVVLGLSEFEEAGAIGGSSAWDRYSYVDADVVLDDGSGTISRLVCEKSSLPQDVARALAAERLDDYVNSFYRAAKNGRDALEEEASLDAAESIPPLLDFLFAVHDRVRPFNRFLRYELERRPLPDLAFTADELTARLAAIRTGDLAEQRSMFRDVEAIARTHGHGDVIDGWEPDLAWLRGD